MDAMNYFFDFLFDQFVAFGNLIDFIFTEPVFLGMPPIVLISVAGLLTFLGVAVALWIVK